MSGAAHLAHVAVADYIFGGHWIDIRVIVVVLSAADLSRGVDCLGAKMSKMLRGFAIIFSPARLTLMMHESLVTLPGCSAAFRLLSITEGFRLSTEVKMVRSALLTGDVLGGGKSPRAKN